MFKSMLVASILLAAWPSQNHDEKLSQEVERAARTYRIDVYNSFRTNRPQFDRLQAVGTRTLDAWKGQGRQPAQAQQVVDWFAKAAATTGAGNTAVPQVPEFVASWQPDNERSPRPGATGSVQVTRQPGPQWVEPESVQTQTSGNTPTENSEPSILRGLGRALLRTVGVGGNNHAALPTNPPGLVSPADDSTAGTPGSEFELSVPEAEAETDAAASDFPMPQIDLDDLKARIDGFNPAISVVNQILEGDDPISTDQLVILAGELETLVQSYTDLQPYLALDNLSEADRSYVGQPQSPESAVEQLRRRIDEASADLELTPDSTDSDAASDEQSLLEDLLLRVNNLELGPES